MSRNCSKCRKINDRPEQRYCSHCHAKNMRAHRAKQKRQQAETVDALAAIRQRMDELAATMTHVKPRRRSLASQG